MYLGRHCIRYIALITLLLSFGVVANAASITFRLDSTKIHVGDQFELQVTVHSSDRAFNALEGVIAFREDFAVLRETRDGDSIINYWIEKPARSQYGEISFSGITPGGYRGARGRLFSIVFEAKKEIPSSAFVLKQVEMFENSGEGIRIPVDSAYIEYTILPAVPGEKKTVGEALDVNPPEVFEPMIVQDESFGGRYVILFATQDKGVGLDRFEIQESWWRPFKVAESPYILKDQTLTSHITIRAIDRNGNIRTVKIPPRHKPLVNEWVEKGAFFLVLVALLIILGKYLYRRART
ncbi:MAG: hypothetical protein EXS68_01670 [Candidatus Ryanbacteria bacterium]|nr:hypothetical protein [Candidatus Ryanbacteria bacterium]